MSHFDAMLAGPNSMWIRQVRVLMAGIFLAVACVSCGGGKQSASSASIGFAAGTYAPPASLGLGAPVSFAAVVNGDPTASGVDWSVTCTPGPAATASCGTIVQHTASGYPTTYTGPSDYVNGVTSIPVGGMVTITAASTANPSQSVTATIQITLPQISVGFNLAPPVSMLTGATANIVVVVSNDSTGAGDDLSVTCESPGACGSIVPAHTGGTVTSFAVYTAPLIVPIGGTVTITAVSTADSTQSVVATVTIKQGKLAISMTQIPPPYLSAGAATNLIGTVVFDPENAGIDWTATCQDTLCGSFSLSHTASGQLTTFTAPPTVPLGSTVTLTAASTTSPTVIATAIVTVTAADLSDGLLNGQYAFLLHGVREGGAWAIAGSLVADGNGNIYSANEWFLGDTSPTAHVLTGTYFIDGDGTGTITLNGAPTGLGYWYNGQQIFRVSAVNSTPGVLLMQEFDGYYDPALHVPDGATLTGTLEQQSISAFTSPPVSPGSSYSFLLSGYGPQNGPAFYGGTLKGSSYAFTLDRSVAGTTDSDSGTVTFLGSSTPGTGRMLFNDATGEPYTFIYYTIDSSHWILVATSNPSGAGDYAAGYLYLQPSPAAAPVGTFAFTEAGATPLPEGSLPLALGGLFSIDALGNVTGLLDANVNGTVTNAPVAGSISTTSTAGRYLVNLTGGAAQQFIAYPTAVAANPAATQSILLLELDPQMAGAGVAYPQTTGAVASAFSGSYATAYQTMGEINTADGGVGSWNDFLGLLTSDGASTLGGSMALDQFDEASQAFWTQTPAATLTGNFAVGPQGRFTGSFTLPPLATSQQVFYILNSSTVLSLGLDSAPSTGVLQLQQIQGSSAHVK